MRLMTAPRTSAQTALLRAVHDQPGATRASISHELGIPSGFAAETVARLVAARLLTEEPAPPTGSRGRPTTSLQAHPDGPVVAVAAAAVGAYTGSLVGAMAGLGAHDDKPHQEERRAGIMLSVRIADPANEKRVIATLRAEGAADIEMADGEWRDGGWSDFDPVAVPRLVS